jgi:type IV secretory pathway TrbD component
MPDFFDNNAAVLNSIQRHAIHIGAARPIDLIDGLKAGGSPAILAQVCWRWHIVGAAMLFWQPAHPKYVPSSDPKVFLFQTQNSEQLESSLG